MYVCIKRNFRIRTRTGRRRINTTFFTKMAFQCNISHHFIIFCVFYKEITNNTHVQLSKNKKYFKIKNRNKNQFKTTYKNQNVNTKITTNINKQKKRQANFYLSFYCYGKPRDCPVVQRRLTFA